MPHLPPHSFSLPNARLRCRLAIGLGALACLAASLPSFAADPDWSSVSFVEHQTYQTIKQDTNNLAKYVSAYTGSGEIRMWGVVINNPADMLDWQSPGDPPTLENSAEWQVFFQHQAIANAASYGLPEHSLDFGGTAAWMGQYYDHMIGWGFEGGTYSANEWTNGEMARLNYPDSTSVPLQTGDLIEIRARGPGLYYKGKQNINERHSTDASMDFDIVIHERGLTPAAQTITLAELKDGSDDFLFDASRNSGCEHYQATLVRLEGVSLDNPQDWEAAKTLAPGDEPLLTISQNGLTFPMRVGLDSDFSAMSAPGTFDVVGILNQESYPGTGGYELWVTSASNISPVPEPSSVILILGGVLLLIGSRRRLLETRRLRS